MCIVRVNWVYWFQYVYLGEYVIVLFVLIDENHEKSIEPKTDGDICEFGFSIETLLWQIPISKNQTTYLLNLLIATIIF